MKAKISVLLCVLAFLGGCGAQREVDIEFQRFADAVYSVDGLRLVLNSNFLFESDRKTLKQDAVKILRSLHRQVKSEYFSHVNVVAHCDDTLTEKTALDITQYQAQVVAGYLWFRGISASELDFDGMGFKEPVATMQTPQGVYLNQRIEILLT